MNKMVDDVLSNVFMFVINNDYISKSDIIQRFKLSIEAVDKIVETLYASNIIGDINEYNAYPVIVKSIEDIHEGVIEYLNEHGFSNDDILDAFKSLNTEEKEEVSIILNEKRDWNDVNNINPDENIPVVVRLVNKNMIYTENKNEVLYAEDIKIGELNNGKWSIIPPYPKYDYSPLTKFGELKEGTIVSHWAEVGADELNGWETRFNRINDYKLKIEVDPEWEENVYRALMWGAAYIAKFGGPDFADEDNELRKLYDILCDMQACIDKGVE